MMALSFLAAIVITLTTWLHGMRSGVRALEAMSN
jgi:hypothetical protein